jgi:hypothetical protein
MNMSFRSSILYFFIVCSSLALILSFSYGAGLVGCMAVVLGCVVLAIRGLIDTVKGQRTAALNVSLLPVLFALLVAVPGAAAGTIGRLSNVLRLAYDPNVHLYATEQARYRLLEWSAPQGSRTLILQMDDLSQTEEISGSRECLDHTVWVIGRYYRCDY